MYALGKVAPVRERGLKFLVLLVLYPNHSRSREGAWIEIIMTMVNVTEPPGRSREGAWIEIRRLSAGTRGKAASLL